MDRGKLLGMCYILWMTRPSVFYVAPSAWGFKGNTPREFCFLRETCLIFLLHFRVTSIFVSIVGRFLDKWFLLMVFYFRLSN
jgi:hypothetical protein